jgi:hypothetical protein
VAVIRLHVHYPDDCPPSLVPFATAEVAARVGETMERRYPGAIADVERWCERHARWECATTCDRCRDAVCEHSVEERGDDLICRDCVRDEDESDDDARRMESEAVRRL